LKHEIRHSDPLNCTFHHFTYHAPEGQGGNQKIPNEIKHLESNLGAEPHPKIVLKEGLADSSASAG
jgi:hypothetical protein